MVPREAKTSNWFSEKDPNKPVSAVAKAAIRQRLGTVQFFLPITAKNLDRSGTRVHQLRVSTRRAQAAMEIFQDVLPELRARTICKQLKRLRSAASDARDLDVLYERLSHTTLPTAEARLSRLLDEIVRCREVAQKPLRKARKRLKRQEFKGEIRGLLKRVRWRGEGDEPPFDAVARHAMGSAAGAFFRAASEALGDPESLHQLRIAGKRLRYAIELLAPAFPTTLRTELYPVFQEVQERLGRANDHATACELFRKWAGDPRRPQGELLQILAVDEERSMETSRQEFLNWWTPRREADLRRRFEAFISGTSLDLVAAPEHTGDLDPGAQCSSTNASQGSSFHDDAPTKPAATAATIP